MFDALMPIIQIAACRLMCSTRQKSEPSEEDIQKNEESWQKYAAFRLRYFCCSTCCLFTIYFGVLIWLVVKDRGQTAFYVTLVAAFVLPIYALVQYHFTRVVVVHSLRPADVRMRKIKWLDS